MQGVRSGWDGKDVLVSSAEDLNPFQDLLAPTKVKEGLAHMGEAQESERIP